MTVNVSAFFKAPKLELESNEIAEASWPYELLW